jgi:nucleosome binding factor SPN SPT16 subunit
MEQQERKRRAMLNKEIRAFGDKIAEAASTSVRNPFCLKNSYLNNL